VVFIDNLSCRKIQLSDIYMPSSLFIISIYMQTYRLDGDHVVFGKVVQGMDTVFAIEGGAGTYSGKPRKKVVIADSGEIPKSQWDEES
jgi:cyclophilin family peptidyl-prolyl cis-trans isomerase